MVFKKKSFKVFFLLSGPDFVFSRLRGKHFQIVGLVILIDV